MGTTPMDLKLPALVLLALSASAADLDQIAGRVFDGRGQPVSGALIIPSPGGFAEWDESQSDGAFKIPSNSTFVSVRHENFVPVLLRARRSQRAVTVELVDRANTTWTIPACEGLPNLGSYVGHGLMVVPPEMQFRAPWMGGDQSSWFIDHGDPDSAQGTGSSLQIDSGGYIHAGLPHEEFLSDVVEHTTRAWDSSQLHGIDLAGTHSDGSRWRWIGTAIGHALHYRHASDEAAEYFDEIITTLCAGYLPRN